MEQEIKSKSCVIRDCKSKAVVFCYRCRFPVCDLHKKKVDHEILCINCYDYLKKSK